MDQTLTLVGVAEIHAIVREMSTLCYDTHIYCATVREAVAAGNGTNQFGTNNTSETIQGTYSPHPCFSISVRTDTQTTAKRRELACNLLARCNDIEAFVGPLPTINEGEECNYVGVYNRPRSRPSRPS